MVTEGLIVAGLSHQTAPVELLGRCALGASGTAGLAALRGREGIREVVALATCNRREIYAVGRDPWAAQEAMAQALAEMTELGLPALAPALATHRGEQAVRHLFRVTSSLDSMVLGESEIQGQVRRAWESARADGATGPTLDRLFRRALQVGRRVRRDTRIGAGRVSVPSVAVGLVERTVGPLTDRRVLIVGAGEMARVVADALASRGVRGVVVVSRSRETAESVAGPRGWRSATLTALPHELPVADVVIAATAAPYVIVTRGDVARAMSARPHRPIALIDMAVPCDIEPGAAAVAGVTLHTMEDIRGLAAANSVERMAQAQLAEALVTREVERFTAVQPRGHVPEAAAAS